MRTIKIFIASSEELKPERRVLADMQAMLNNQLFKHGVMLQLEFWEHLDSSMGLKHKQEEYNDVLKECDGCIVLFWKKFGEFTKEEFEKSYKGISSGGNPKQLSVLFKETTEHTPDLKAFKDEFVANYGDLSSPFNTNDQLRLALIEQVEKIIPNDLNDTPLYTTSENQVLISGAVMDRIKVLNVYIAMADDVEIEQNEFMDLVSHINKIFIRRNMCLNIIKHKQNMGDLSECELCMTLYCTKFGDYTKEDLEGAYKELQEGNNPRKLYVFFKNSEDVTPELHEFKESFATAYGHFFCKFENADTMRLEFLLQLEAYQNTTAERLLKVENQKIKIGSEADGYEDVADLNKVPFAKNNEEFNRLKNLVSDLAHKLNQVRIESMSDPTNETLFNQSVEIGLQLKETKNKFEEHQQFLFDISLEFSKMVTSKISQRTVQAMELFNQGFANEANDILDSKEMDKDADNLEKQRKELDDSYIAMINDYIAKTKIVMGADKLSIETRIETASNAYERAISMSQKINYNKDKYADIIFHYARFLDKFAKYKKAEELYSNYIVLCEEIYGINNIQTIRSYEYIGELYKEIQNTDNAVNYFKKAIVGYNQLYGSGYYIAIGLSLRALLLLPDGESDNIIENNIPYNMESKECDIVKVYEYLLPYKDEYNTKIIFAILDLPNILHQYKCHLSQNNGNVQSLHEYEKVATLLSIVIDKNIYNWFHDKPERLALRRELCEVNCFCDEPERLALCREAIGYCHKIISIKEINLGALHEDLSCSYQMLARLYHEINDNDKAEVYIDMAINIKLKTVGEVHPEVALLLVFKGEIIYNNNQELAKDIFIKAAHIYEKLDMSLTTPASSCYAYIGWVYFYKEDYVLSLKFFLKSIKIYDKLIIELDRYKEGTINLTLACLYENIEEVFRPLEALSYIEEELGRKHVYYALVYRDIGYYYRDKKEHESALKYFLIEEEVNASLGLQPSYGNIINTYLTLDMPRKAIEYLHKKKDYWLRRQQGGDNRDVIKYTYEKLGDNYNAIFEYNSAIENYLYALEANDMSSDFEGYFTSNIYQKLINVYCLLHDYSMIQKCYDEITSIYNNDDALTISDKTTYYNINIMIGNYLYENEQYEDVLKYYINAINIQNDTNGLEHANIAQSYVSVGDVYINIKDYMKALEFLNKSLTIWTEINNGITEECATTYNNIGYIYNEIGDYQKALDNHQKALEIRLELLGEDDIMTANSYHHLGKTYNYMEDYLQSLVYLEKAWLIREQELGRKHINTIATQELLEKVRTKIL